MSSKIEWCDESWNPWYGCNPVGTECTYCYAKREMLRYKKDFSTVQRAADSGFFKPHRIKPGKTVFACSWGDWFHEKADPWRAAAWQVIRECREIKFIILTKRIDRAAVCMPDDWSAESYPHVALGISCGDTATYNIYWQALRKIDAAAYLISHEPALGYLNCSSDFWELGAQKRAGIITGGETGSAAGVRPMHLWWARNDRDNCRDHNTPFFFKGWGEWVPGTQHPFTSDLVALQNGQHHLEPGSIVHYWSIGGVSVRVGKRNAGSLLDGKRHTELPEVRICTPETLSLFS